MAKQMIILTVGHQTLAIEGTAAKAGRLLADLSGAVPVRRDWQADRKLYYVDDTRQAYEDELIVEMVAADQVQERIPKSRRLESPQRIPKSRRLEA